MSSKIEEFNFNSSFQSIVDSNPSGIIKRCVIPGGNVLKKSADAILFCASSLSKKNSGDVFLSVKIPLGSRDKRVEVVYKPESNSYILIKCCVSNQFDRDAIELQSIIDELISNHGNIIVYGLMILSAGQASTDLSKDFFEVNAPMVRSALISDFKNLEVLIGLLDKSKRSF